MRKPTSQAPGKSASRRDDAQCPCGSGWTYELCCGPLHRGEREAADPSELMRSRFAAFARGEVAYLWRTLHADHDDRARPRAVVEAELARACRSARYDRLRVIDAAHDASSGQVLFHAAVRVDGKDQSFVELSDFLHDGTGWRYLCGVSRPAPAGSPAARVGSIDAYWALVRER